MDFNTYLIYLAEHEEELNKNYLNDPRNAILVNAGVRLSWLGDFLANPDIKWELKVIKTTDLRFTGAIEIMHILMDKCGGKPEKLLPYIETDTEAKDLVYNFATYSEEPILARKKNGKYLVLDGMHRLVGAVLQQRKEIQAFIPINEDEILPFCEAHVIYDLIRGYQRI